MRGDVRAGCMGIERAVAQPVMHHSGGESWVVALASAQRLAHRAGVSIWFLKNEMPHTSTVALLSKHVLIADI